MALGIDEGEAQLAAQLEPGSVTAASIADSPAVAPFRFRAGHAFMVFLAYLGAQIGAGFAVGLVSAIAYGAMHGGAGALPERVSELLALMGGLLGLVASGPVILWLARRSLRREATGDPLAQVGWAPSALRVRLSAALAGLALGAAYLIVCETLFPPKDWDGGLMGRAILSGGWPLFAWVATALAIAPLIEEFMFRGVLWTGFTRSWGPIASTVLVTSLFVLLHLPEAAGYWPALVFIGLMGLAAIRARVVSGSLGPSMFLHAGYNAALVVAVLGATL